MKLNHLDQQDLMDIVFDSQECYVMRWEAFRVLLKDFDWHYNYSDDHSIWRKGNDDYIELKRACRVLSKDIDEKRALSMFNKAEQEAYG